MKYQYIAVLLAGLAALTMTACEEEPKSQIGDPITSTAETQPATIGEIPEGAIVDDHGEYVYTGKLQQIGCPEDGYMMVPLGYMVYESEENPGLTQYISPSGSNMFTLDRYSDMSYETAAQSLRYSLELSGEVEGLSGATTTVAGYNALRLYCVYPEYGIHQVIWLIEDPADPENSCYYLGMEFVAADINLIACSSTFRTAGDYAAQQSE